MERMTLDQVDAWVERIKNMAGDDEMAHSEEDELHASVLADIAQHGDPHSRALASLALKTGDIGFCRWCA